MASKNRRQQRLSELISVKSVHSQNELCDLLQDDGIVATQATLSRDLREMGVTKGRGGYLLPDQSAGPEDAGDALQRSLEREMLAVDCSAALIVLHTQPGHANSLAIEFDRVGWPEITGTIAGDDTIFIAVQSAAVAGEIANRLRLLADF